MPDTYSANDVLDFLAHASERGLMPAATAQALAVAARNVFAVLDESERAALPVDDLEAVIKRFTNKRARDFRPDSLKEYGRRVRRAVELFIRWREDAANFSVRTRTTQPATRKRVRGTTTPDGQAERDRHELSDADERGTATAPGSSGSYQTLAFPVRPGHVVTIANVPHDLSVNEAGRLAQFIALLAPRAEAS